MSAADHLKPTKGFVPIVCNINPNSSHEGLLTINIGADRVLSLNALFKLYALLAKTFQIGYVNFLNI